MRLTLGLVALALLLAGCGTSSSSAGDSRLGVNHAAAGGGAASGAPTPAALSGSKSDSASAVTTTGLPPLGPQVIKTAQVDLRVAHGQIGRVIIQATRVAGNQHGFVLSTDVARESGYADLVMRVPAARFERALTALATLSGVTVTAQTVTGREVGQEFVDLNARKTNLQAQEGVLRRLMNEAQTVSDTIAVENQLASVQGQIDEIQGRLRYLADQTALSTITVEMREHQAPAPPPPGKPSTIGAAFRRGWQGTLDVVAGVIVALGFLLPLALLVLLVLVIAWRLRPVAARITNRSSQRPAAE